MIDSISASNNIPKLDVNRIMNTLKNVREVVVKDTGEVIYKATVSNKKMNVSINGDWLKIDGSLSQYYTESFSSLLWNEVPLAICKLEDELQLKLGNLNLSRIDLESTFPVQQKPKQYFEFLGDAPYFNRFEEKNTLYYNSGNRKKRIYDKSIKTKNDLKISSSDIQNIMRFETSFRNNYLTKLGKDLDIAKLKIEHLFDPIFQEFLLNLWYKEFDEIKKFPKLNFDFSNIQGVRDFKSRYMSSKIEEDGGILKIIDMVKRSNYTNPKMDSNLIYKIKSALEDYTSKPLNVIPCSQLQELNTNIAIAFLTNHLSLSK